MFSNESKLIRKLHADYSHATMYGDLKELKKLNSKLPISKMIDEDGSNILFYFDSFNDSFQWRNELIPLKNRGKAIDYREDHALYDPIIKYAVSKGVALEKRNKFGRTPFLAMACKGALMLMKLLENNGADVNVVCDDGRNAVLYFVAVTHYSLTIDLKIKETLIYFHSKNINLDVIDKNGQNAFHHMAKLIWCATEYEEKKKLKEKQIAQDRLEGAKFLIGKKVPVDLLDSDKHSPLLIAAKKGNAILAELLIDSGANVNICDKDGLTPLLHFAKHNGYSSYCQIVKALFEHGADLKACSIIGWNALHYAASIGNISLVRYLVEDLKFSVTDLTTDERKTAEDLSIGDVKKYFARIHKEKEKEPLVGKPVSYPNSHSNVLTQGLQPRDTSTPLSSRFTLDTEVTKLLQELSIAKSQLEYGRELGKGGFGVVYKGSWHGEDVAIKQLKAEHLKEESNFKQFIEEANMMFKLRNPRVVTFYGITDNYPCDVVMEFMPRGSLRDVLVLSKPEQMTWKVRLTYAQDVASGLAYLHGLSRPIIHCDLKSLNVLVDTNDRAKLTDFGLAVLKKGTSSTQAVSSTKDGCGTPQWMAPELLNGEPNTTGSDMYAFGVVLWEIATHRIPFADLQIQLMSLMLQIVQGLREEFKDNGLQAKAPQGYEQLAKRSWSAVIDERPSANEALTILKEISVSLSNGSFDVPQEQRGILSPQASEEIYQANTLVACADNQSFKTQGSNYQLNTEADFQQPHRQHDIKSGYQANTQIVVNSADTPKKENTQTASAVVQSTEPQHSSDHQLNIASLANQEFSGAVINPTETITVKVSEGSSQDSVHDNDRSRSLLPAENNNVPASQTTESNQGSLSGATPQPTRATGDKPLLVGFKTAPIPRRISERSVDVAPPPLPERVYTKRKTTTLGSGSALGSSSMSSLPEHLGQVHRSTTSVIPQPEKSVTLAQKQEPPAPEKGYVWRSTQASSLSSSPVQTRKPLPKPPSRQQTPSNK